MSKTIARFCSVVGCGRPLASRGWCAAHYTRWKRTGEPGSATIRPRPARDLDAYFWDKIDKTESCWVWTGARVNGYGVVTRHGQMNYVHRVAYEMLIGPIPGGFTLDHLCHTHSSPRCELGGLCLHRACANPAHLEPVPGPVNTLRGFGPSGENSRKTHCKRGHPLSGANLYRKNGRRHCRACRSANASKRRN